jgi:hypothetical protein
MMHSYRNPDTENIHSQTNGKGAPRTETRSTAENVEATNR